MSIFAALLSAGSLLLPTVCTCPRLMSGSMTVTPSFGLLGSTLMIPKPCTMILTVLKDGRDGTVKALGPMGDWVASAAQSSMGPRALTVPSLPSFNTVNIIVHGFGIIKVEPNKPKDGVTVMLPDINLGHVHTVGSNSDPADKSAAKIDIDDEYHFENLVGAGASPSFDTTRDIVMSLGSVDTSFFDGPNGLRRIRLPYPQSIFSLKCGRRADQRPLIKGSDSSVVKINPITIALVHVQTYGRNAVGDVILRDSNGTPVFTVGLDTRSPGRTNGNCHVHNSFPQPLKPAPAIV